MKKKTPALSLMSLLFSFPVAAQVVEVGDLSAFKEALKSVKAPSAPSAGAAPAAPGAKACASVELSGATVGRGMFQTDLRVDKGDAEVGRVSHDGSRYLYVVGGATAAEADVKGDGDRKVATVLDCAGRVVGTIVEEDSGDSSRYTLADASGKVLARSDATSGPAVTMMGDGGFATIRNAHWILDKYALETSGLDSRLVLMTAAMNDSVLYRRAAERRREHIGDHHGRGDR